MTRHAILASIVIGAATLGAATLGAATNGSMPAPMVCRADAATSDTYAGELVPYGRADGMPARVWTVDSIVPALVPSQTPVAILCAPVARMR